MQTEASRWSSSSRSCCALNALFSSLKLGLWKGRSFRIPEKPASPTSVNDIRYIVPKFWRIPYPVNVSRIPCCILSKSRVIRRYPSRPCALGCCSKASLPGAAQWESASLWAAHQANLSFSFAKTNRGKICKYFSWRQIDRPLMFIDAGFLGQRLLSGQGWDRWVDGGLRWIGGVLQNTL